MKFLNQAKKFNAVMMHPLFRAQAKKMASIQALINEIMKAAWCPDSINPITKEKIILKARSISETTGLSYIQALQQILGDV